MVGEGERKEEEVVVDHETLVAMLGEFDIARAKASRG